MKHKQLDFYQVQSVCNVHLIIVCGCVYVISILHLFICALSKTLIYPVYLFILPLALSTQLRLLALTKQCI